MVGAEGFGHEVPSDLVIELTTPGLQSLSKLFFCGRRIGPPKKCSPSRSSGSCAPLCCLFLQKLLPTLGQCFQRESRSHQSKNLTVIFLRDIKAVDLGD